MNTSILPYNYRNDFTGKPGIHYVSFCPDFPVEESPSQSVYYTDNLVVYYGLHDILHAIVMRILYSVFFHSMIQIIKMH